MVDKPGNLALIQQLKQIKNHKESFYIILKFYTDYLLYWMNLQLSEFTLCKCAQKYICQASLNRIIQELRFQQKTNEQSNIIIHSQQQKISQLRKQVHQFTCLVQNKNKALNQLQIIHIDLVMDHELLIKQYKRLEVQNIQNNKIFQEKSQAMLQLVNTCEKIIVQYENRFISWKRTIQQNNMHIQQIKYSNKLLESQRGKLLNTIQSWKNRYNQVYDHAKKLIVAQENLENQKQVEKLHQQMAAIKKPKDTLKFRPWQRSRTFRSDFTEKINEEHKTMISSYPFQNDSKKVLTYLRENQKNPVMFKVAKQSSKFSRDTRSKTSYQGKKQYQCCSPKSIEALQQNVKQDNNQIIINEMKTTNSHDKTNLNQQ